MAEESPRRWCVLVHALPARPLYLRAKVRRQLALAGAAPLKKAVYVMPRSDQGLERLRAIAAEIQSAGAAAFVCEATFPDAETEAVVTRAYQHELTLRYREWIRDARRVGDRPARLADLRARLEALRTRDLFDSPGADEAVAMLAEFHRGQGAAAAAPPAPGTLVGLRWVTRRGLHVDRLACAWVVRRFIDPSARFRFVASGDALIDAAEIGFDMPGAAITHEGGRCSVETLVHRAGIRDPAVRRIAEIVHDIDLKDGRHGHPETAGFEQLLVGTLRKHPQDDDRLEHGLALFDALYAAAPGTRPAPTLAPPRERRPQRGSP